MSTAGNLRVTRSASKARSTGAGSTGAPSVGASSRARSRRAGAVASLAEDDMPAVGNQVTRAYGTEGKSAQAQLLSAQIGMSQAVNPIANAVARAQAPETPIADTSGRLPALNEEPEDHEGSEHRDESEHREESEDRESTPFRINSRSPSVDSYQGEPFVQPSYFSERWSRVTRWAAGRINYHAEGPNRTGNNIIADNMEGHFNRGNEPQVNDFPMRPGGDRIWSWRIFLTDAMFVLFFLAILISFYEVSRISIFGFGAESGISKAPNAMFQSLHNRVTKLEKHVRDLSLSPKSVDNVAAKHQINWFTPGLGTGIDLYLSSPTLSRCDPTWTPEGWPWSMFKSQTCPQISMSQPHFAALSPWFDPVDDSWCAPPSDGKLQLTVVLPRTVAPTELVVEHAAMDELPAGYMNSSPREIELWIHVPNDAKRQTLMEAINHVNPSLLEYSSPQGKILGDRQALPFDYVPVGRWEYDIWTNQALQTFPLSLPLAQYDVGTSRVAVRVNSNWGNAKFTCLSRLRLYGDDTSGMTEELDRRVV